MNIVLHPKTTTQITSFTASPPQAIVITGKKGSGKQTVASVLAATLLNTDIEDLQSHPYFLRKGEGETSISIDSVRDIQHFLSRKSTNTGVVQRVALVVDADKLTPEAQNAFLKTLEEPPQGTVLLLTVSDKQQLLPTILSRVQILDVILPNKDTTKAYFSAACYDATAVDLALLMSG